LFTYAWNEYINSWEYSQKDEYDYDTNYLFSNAYHDFASWVYEGKNLPNDHRTYSWNKLKKEWSQKFELEIPYYSAFEATKVTKPVENSINFYPNPVKDRLYIRNIAGNGLVLLYSMEGQLLRQTNQSTIDFSTFRSGLYIIDVNGVKTKIIKE
jgi:hypothetical protein